MWSDPWIRYRSLSHVRTKLVLCGMSEPREGHCFEFFLITLPTRCLVLYLRRSCVMPWECCSAFPAKVQRRGGIQRTPPKSCTTQPGICSDRTLGVHPVLHRYHWWSEKISEWLVSLLWFKQLSVHWRNEKNIKCFFSFGNFTKTP